MTDNYIKKYKGAALFVCLFIVLFIFSSCSPHQQSQDTADINDDDASVKFISLALFSGEPLNPYTASFRANKDILSLCYNGLFVLDDKWDAAPVLASAYTMEGNTATIYLKTDAVFSDGTKVSASDCVYSFNLAKASGSVYSARFSYISSYKAKDSETLEVRFTTDSPYNINLLDIPVIKAKTDKKTYATGAGAFVIKTGPGENDEDAITLYPNTHYSFAEGKIPEKISVVSYDTAEELLYGFNYGNIHAIYAELSEENAEYRGNIEISPFTTNNMVFAYLNPYKSHFTSRAIVAKGISYGIDRDKIISEVLGGYAAAAWYPFNPSWSKTVAAELNNEIYSPDMAKSLFYDARLYIKEGVLEWYSKPLEITILVNAESLCKTEVAQKLAEQLNSYGFVATVNAQKWTDYTSLIAKGDYDIYIGEVKIPSNMDISEMSKITGLSYTYAFSQAIQAFNSSTITMSELLTVFSEEMPFVPLYFTQGALAVNRSVTGNFIPSESYLFFDVETWSVK